MVKKTKNGKWRVEISAGYDKNGNQRKIRKQGFLTKKDALDYESKERNKLMKGYLENDAKKINFGQFIKKWYLDFKAPQISPNTKKRYINHLNNYIIPSLGTYSLNQISNIIIQDFYNSLINKQLKPSTIKKILETLSGCLRYAKKNKLIEEIPLDIEKHKLDKSKMAFWTKSQLDYFLEQIKDTYLYFPVLLEVNLGTRPSELCGLRWLDINFESGYINIENQQIINDSGVSDISDILKTDTSPRKIILSPKMLSLLKKEKSNRNALNTDYIVTELSDVNYEAKYPCRSNNLNNNFENMLKKVNKEKSGEKLPKISLNCLRHTHATLLLENGINVKAVSKRLGHKDINTTLKYYAHVTETMNTQIAETLDKMF